MAGGALPKTETVQGLCDPSIEKCGKWFAAIDTELIWIVLVTPLIYDMNFMLP